MKCILAVVVLVATATKMAEACCLPDQAKADMFFMMNVTQHTPQGAVNMEISGMGNFALDFTAQKFSGGVGPIIMKQGQMQIPILMRATFLMDVGKGNLIMNIVGPNGHSQCVSQKVVGKLTEKHQCMPDNSGMMQVMSTPEMTMYQVVEKNTQVTLALDANCIPKLLQTATTLPNDKGYFAMQLAVDNIELGVEDGDFAAPCYNPMAMPGPPMKIPPPEQSVKLMSSSMIAEEAMRRRR